MLSASLRLSALPAVTFALLLTGCGGGSSSSTTSSPPPPITPAVTQSGVVTSGAVPITGATIQLYAVGTSADGSAATPLLTSAVVTSSTGTFTIQGSEACPSQTALVYLLATGGNPGLAAGTNNSGITLMDAIGPCSSLTSTSTFTVNEITSIAAVSALQPYVSSPTAVGSGSSDAASLAAAFTLAAELANPTTGATPGTAVPTGDTVPTTLINTLADIVATCVNSTGGSPGDGSACGTLYTLTQPPAAAAPTNTLAALLSLAGAPTLNTLPLFNLASSAGPFQPILTEVPPSFAIRLTVPTSLQTTPTTLTFASTPVGIADPSQSITLTNTGTAAITFSSHSLSGPSSADFAQTSNCAATLQPQATCSANVTFTPTATGSRVAYLNIASSAPGSPQSILLQGTAVAATPAVTLSPTSLTFPAQAIGTTSAFQSVTVTNTGSATLTFTGVTLASSDYVVVDSCTSALAPNAHCALLVFFAPTTAGTRTASLQILSNASTSPTSLPLTGTGVAVPVGPVTLSPTSLAFNDFSPAQPVTVTNSGALPLNITSVDIPPGFTQTNTCGSVLPGNSVCTIMVSQALSLTGPFTGTLSLTDNDTTDSQTVALTSTLDQVYDFGTWPIGTQSTSNLTIQPDLGAGYTFSVSGALTGPNPGDFLFPNGSACSQPFGAPDNPACPLVLISDPTASGRRFAVLTVTFPTGNTPSSTTYLLTAAGAAAGAPAAAFTPVAPFTATERTATQKTLTLTNTGPTTLQIAGVPAFTTSSTDVVINSTTCASLAPAASCTVTITDTPSTEGKNNVTISVTDSASTQSFSTTFTTTAGYLAVTTSPQSLIFPAMHLNTSATMTFTVNNPDAHALTIVNQNCTSNCTVPFQFTPTTCAAVSCPITVTYSPVQANSALYDGETLLITDTVSELTTTEMLQGTPGIANVSLNPATLTFPSRSVGTTSTPLSAQVTNSGDGYANFAVAAPTGAAAGDFLYSGGSSFSLAPNATAPLSYSFAPTATGTRTASVPLTINPGPSTLTLILSGTATPATPTLSVSPSSLTFSAQALTTTSTPQTLTLTNTSSTALTLSGITLTGTNPGDYALTNPCGSTLAAAATCSLSVTFTPSAAGSRTASLQILSNASSSPNLIPISGTGVIPTPVTVALSTGSLTFYEANIAQPVILTNQGATPLSISSIGVSSNYAQINSCGVSLAALASCTIYVSTTLSGSAYTGTLTIQDNATSTSQTVSLTSNLNWSHVYTLGEYTTPVVAFSPEDPFYSFNGGVFLQTINSGGTNYNFYVYTLTVSGNVSDFTGDGDNGPYSCLTRSGMVCTVPVYFTPQTPGLKYLLVSDNEGNTFLLKGTAIAANSTPAFSLSPSPLSFPTTTVGSSASATVTVNNLSTTILTFSNPPTLTTGSLNNGDFSVTSSCSTVPAFTAPAPQSCTLAITFKPTATGTRQTTLTLTEASSGVQQTLFLQGQGS